MKILAILTALTLLLVANVLAAGLEITEIEVHVDYDEAHTYRIENRERLDFTAVSLVNNSKIDVDVLPGSNVTFTVRVENTFSPAGSDLRDILVTVTIEEIDDGADLEADSSDFDLEPGDDRRVDIKFNIPLNVDAGTYNVIVEADSEDRNGTPFNAKLNFKFEVDKQSHDIRITKAILNPGILDCDRKTKLTSEIMNLGSNMEDQVALEFKAAGIGINSYDKDITLASSDEATDEEKIYTKTLNIEVPDFFKSGTFPILINLYWKNFILFDQKTVDLVVKDCASKPPMPKEEKNNNSEQVILIQPEEEKEEEQPKQTDLVIATKEISILKSPMLLLAVLGGLLAAIFVLVAVIALIKQK